MPDRLVIHDLVAKCHLGVFEWERETPQTIWIDIELAIDASRAAKRDRVQDTIDYGRLVTALRQAVEHRSFRLLETLAEEIASLIFREFRTSHVKVRVKKRSLSDIGYAAVEIERSVPRYRAGARPSRRSSQHTVLSSRGRMRLA